MHPLSNLHTHSNLSDGKNSLEEMVLAALERGFVSLGFSDHGYSAFDSCAMSPEKEEKYHLEAARLKEKYAGQIELALGYEHEFLASDSDFSPYEYVIESVHWLHRGGEYIPVDYRADVLLDASARLYGGDIYALTADYYDLVCRSVQQTSGQIVGHIDLITKFNENDCMFSTSDPRFMNPALDALKLAVERDLIVEINTGAMSRGYRSEPYPNPRLLRALKEMGGRITISSDCHRAEWMDFAFDQAVELARACGFRETYIWKDGGLKAVSL